MATGIVRAARAAEDLSENWLWIARNGPAAADGVFDAIKARWSLPVAHPLSEPVRDDILQGHRHLVTGQCLVLYQVEAATVRVLHGQRRIAKTDVAAA